MLRFGDTKISVIQRFGDKTRMFTTIWETHGGFGTPNTAQALLQILQLFFLLSLHSDGQLLLFTLRILVISGENQLRGNSSDDLFGGVTRPIHRSNLRNIAVVKKHI